MEYNQNTDNIQEDQSIKQVPFTELSEQEKQEWNTYYQNQRQQQLEQRVSNKIAEQVANLTEADLIEGDLLSTNPFTKVDLTTGSDKRLIGSSPTVIRDTVLKERRIAVNSIDRDTNLYPHPYNFSIHIPEFHNVREITLLDVQFPNTANTINSTNNALYWVNQEDITSNITSASTGSYPIYFTNLTNGNYAVGTIQNFLPDVMNPVKRQNGNGPYHYFLVTADNTTDVMTFVSLNQKPLGTNAFSSLQGSGTITVHLTSHGFTTGQTVYFVGAQTFAGISSTILNSVVGYTATYIDANNFSFNLPINAVSTSTGGGPTAYACNGLPFKFLFGEYSNVVAPSIGFDLQDSSQLDSCYVTSIQNLYAAQITTLRPHGFTNSYTYIGHTIFISSANTTPSVNGTQTILQILDQYNFLITTSSPLTVNDLNSSASFVFGSNVYLVSSIQNYSSKHMAQLTTNTNHYYNIASIGQSFLLFNSGVAPDMDGPNTILNVPSTTTIVVQIPQALFVTSTPTTCYIPQNTPLTSNFPLVSNITTINSTTLQFTTSTNHNLIVGDSFMTFNFSISSTHATNSINTFTVTSVPSNTTLQVSVSAGSYYTLTNVNQGLVNLGTGLLTMVMPNHGFNEVVSIGTGTSVSIVTLLPHGLSSGSTVYISGTNSTPSIDGFYTVSSVTNSLTFVITFSGGVTVSGNSGILARNYNFFLYGATDIGGISNSLINSVQMTVRNVIDVNTFTFMVPTAYSSKLETGGGNALYISSLLHGFSTGVQRNILPTNNNQLVRSLTLGGENYVYFLCDQIPSRYIVTGPTNIQNIYAKYLLTTSPSSIAFDGHVGNQPIVFEDNAIPNFGGTTNFQVVYADGTYYNFNNVDYSFTLQIKYQADRPSNTYISDQRGA